MLTGGGEGKGTGEELNNKTARKPGPLKIILYSLVDMQGLRTAEEMVSERCGNGGMVDGGGILKGGAGSEEKSFRRKRFCAAMPNFEHGSTHGAQQCTMCMVTFLRGGGVISLQYSSVTEIFVVDFLYLQRSPSNVQSTHVCCFEFSRDFSELRIYYEED